MFSRKQEEEKRKIKGKGGYVTQQLMTIYHGGCQNCLVLCGKKKTSLCDKKREKGPT